MTEYCFIYVYIFSILHLTSPKITCKLLVSNVSSDADQSQLRALFQQYGEVLDCTIDGGQAFVVCSLMYLSTCGKCTAGCINRYIGKIKKLA